MTRAQHEALSFTAGGTADAVTVTDAGAVTAADAIETYNVSSGGSNNVTVNADKLDVDVAGHANNATTVTVNDLTVTGDYTLENAEDIIVATDGADISGVNDGGVTSAENLNLTGGITMTRAQHEALSFTAGGTADAVTVTDAGAVTAADAIETYNVSSGGSNNVTVNADKLDVDVAGHANNATTVTVNDLTVTGDYTLENAEDIIVATDGADISGVNDGGVTSAENLNLTGGITMTRAQHEALSFTAVGPLTRLR
jgi:hypothetical protein